MECTFVTGDLNVVDELEPELTQDTMNTINLNEEIADSNGTGGIDEEEADFYGSDTILDTSEVIHTSVPDKKTKERVDYICLDDKCSFKTTKKTLLSLHLKEFHSELLENFPCSECSYVSKLRGNLNKHMSEVHAKVKRYMCGFCGAQTSRKYHLTRHIKAVHHGEKFFCCQDCDYKTNNKVCLQKHIGINHDTLLMKDNSKPPLKDSELTCVCTWCEYKSNKYAEVKIHIKLVHDRTKKFPCKECEFVGSSVENYAEHYNEKHKTEEYKHACADCTFRSSNKVAMKEHYLEVHKKKKINVCRLCNFKSMESSSMKRHINNAHKYKRVNLLKVDNNVKIDDPVSK